MGAKKTTAEMATAWQQGMNGASARYTKGINQTTVNPMEAAAAQKDKAVANFAAALNSGQWSDRLRSTPVSYWKSQAVNNAARLGTGAQKALPKFTKAMQDLAPVHDEMRAASASAGSDPIAKASAALRVLIAAGRKGKAMGMSA